MGRYDDVLDFLAKHERKREARMNQRTTFTADELQAIRTKYPGVPDDYLDYLAEVGQGAFRECQYAVYGGFTRPDEVFDAESAASLGKRVLCFGDNFSGDLGGFLPDEDWKVVEIWHDSMTIYETNQSFEAFIRQQMLMGEDGTDLRGRKRGGSK